MKLKPIAVSVITPTVRIEGLKIVQRALKRQSFKDWEWIVGSPAIPEVDCIWIKDEYKDGFWSLNRIYNDLIEKAQGDLIVSWQDYTFADPDTLSNLWLHWKKDSRNIVGAVGNKYSDDTWSVKTWQDPREREDFGSFYEVNPSDVEWNLCSVPKKALYDIGGFDEEMDHLGFGMDGFAVNHRIDALGDYKFYLDQSIKSYSLEHDRPENWEESNLLHGGYLERKKFLVDNEIYPKLEYL